MCSIITNNGGIENVLRNCIRPCNIKRISKCVALRKLQSDSGMRLITSVVVPEARVDRHVKMQWLSQTQS